MKKKAVIVRISDEARKRLKVKAIQAGHKSMISYVDELSKLTLNKNSGVTGKGA